MITYLLAPLNFLTGWAKPTNNESNAKKTDKIEDDGLNCTDLITYEEENKDYQDY